MKHFDVFLIFVAVRLLSVFFVQTSYVPDEYWQSLEVAHNLVFGYGHLTWEWKTGIRSYIFPLIFAGLYKILQMLHMDFPELIILAPRILMALFSAYSDLCFYRWSGTKKWAVFTVSTSWFWFYTSSRTLINTFETILSTIAFSKFPWLSKYKDENLTFIWLVAILCVVRPTAAVIWFPLCLYHLAISKHSAWFLIYSKYFPIGVVVLMVSTIIDSWAYGTFTLSSLQFFKYNIIYDFSTFYGSNPWHWYLSSGFPAIVGIKVIPFILSSLVILKNRKNHPNELIMLGTIFFSVFVYSVLPHKEFRFLLPLLPLVLYISSKFLSAWSRKANMLHLWIAAVIIFMGNLVPTWYLSMVHQRGTLDVMSPLRELALNNPQDSNFLFLMPCHSTPYYSHLHVNVTARFLTCNPNLGQSPNYVTEEAQFYENPMVWLRRFYPPTSSLPSHIICFDHLAPSIADILSRYKKIHHIFHAHVLISPHVSKNVLVYERIDLN